LKITDTPGPGSYNPNPEFVDPQPSAKYSMRGKTSTVFQPFSEAPGPGRYNIKNSWLEKEKILSNDRKKGAPLIRLTTDPTIDPLDIPFCTLEFI
jgi:hypothetical protein